MGLSAADLDENGLKIGISPEHFRAVAMPLLFDHPTTSMRSAKARWRSTARRASSG